MDGDKAAPPVPWVKTITVTNIKGEVVPVEATDVDGFLAAYAADGNTFWRCDLGHIQNVLDELIERSERTGRDNTDSPVSP